MQNFFHSNGYIMNVVSDIEISDNKMHEYAFTQADFERTKKLIYKHAGISLSSSKHKMVYSRLARRLRDIKNVGRKNFTINNLILQLSLFF